MPRKSHKRPTEAELAILQVLWQWGPSTVRQVHERLSRGDEIGYTTVLKTLQIMMEKDLASRTEAQRAHVYSARLSEEQTQKTLLSDLVQRAFRGSASKLVLRALADKRTTKEEIEEIRKLLDKISGER